MIVLLIIRSNLGGKLDIYSSDSIKITNSRIQNVKCKLLPVCQDKFNLWLHESVENVKSRSDAAFTLFLALFSFREAGSPQSHRQLAERARSW